MYAILTRTMVAQGRPQHRPAARITLGALATVLAMFALTGCGVGAAPGADVARQTVTLDGVPVEVEIADSSAERSLGLQEHQPLAPGEGMLFVFPGAEPRTFAMKEVSFPIDVLFIAEDMTVSAVEPLSPGDARLVSSPGRSSDVLELPQGWAVERGIGVGSAFVAPH
jgi:uncharacterized membrane protein (UPF0127 family)